MTLGGSKNVQPGLMLATVLSVSIWSAPASAYTPEQQQACSGDAFRLWSGDSGRRSRHRLHDPQQVPALAGLSGVLQAGSRAERKCGRVGRPADGDQTRKSSTKARKPKKKPAET
jgi:hypothetical protein